MLKFLAHIFGGREMVGLELSDGDRAVLYGWPDKTVQEVYGINKFNRWISNICTRLAFWYRITAHLAGFDALLKAQGHLTPDDFKAFKRLHKALADCYSTVKERVSVHQDELQR